MISRVLEEKGLSTVAISLVREHTVKVKPPRALYVPFPFGFSIGRPNDRDEQRAVLDAAFATLEASSGPVLADFAAAVSGSGAPLQASDVAVEEDALAADFATEVTLMRRYWEQRYSATGRTSVGLSKIAPQRFRGLVRFLEAYVAGSESDSPDRPPDVPLPAFIRACVDDLRMLYAEARLQTHPDESSVERQRWLLGGTALGVFLRKLRDHMDASADPQTKAVAFGVAR